jgi:hypothetical protein
MSEIDFGHMVSLQDASLVDEPVKAEQTQNVLTDAGNALWSYHNEGTIRGIPVADNAVGLPIDKESMLDVAFNLKRTPRSKIFWMSPEDEDSIKLYDGLLSQQAQGRLVIVDELKQYDMNKCKFMVWVRYDELLFELNPRFEYLREELTNG